MNATDGVARPDRVRGDGPYAELGDMITGAGWIPTGPGYRTHLLGGRADADATTAISWNLYQILQGSFELPHLAHDHTSLGGRAMHQDLRRVDYFGEGNSSSEDDGSAYRCRNANVLAYGTYRATPWLLLEGRTDWTDCVRSPRSRHHEHRLVSDWKWLVAA